MEVLAPIPEDFDVRIRWTQFIPHSPTEKQHAALWPVDLEEVMYGGQAGGGKSDWLLMAALQYVDVPGYAALILRQSFPDLNQPGAIMTRAKEWLAGTEAKWNENTRTFTFPSGAKLVFGFLKRDDDVYQYQGAEYQFIGFDELTQFTEFQYTYMHSRLRRPRDMRVPLRMRVATNPGGKGHQWVRRYWIKEGASNGRMFVPASIDDNIYLDQESYKRSLQHLDPYTKAQLLFGDWSARPPGNWAFDHEHLDAVFSLGRLLDEKRFAGTLEDPVDGVIHNGMDFGEFSHIVLGWGREMGGMYIPLEHTYEKGEPDREAKEWIAKIRKGQRRGEGEYLGQIKHPFGRSRFDSSKPESMRLFYREFKTQFGAEQGKPTAVAFNKWKRASILHMRGMASRTAWGEKFGTLGISSQYCPLLEDQFYKLEFKGEDSEDLVKVNDHGPDAVFSLLAPEIKKWVPPAEKPDQVKAREEAKRQETMSTLASG